MATVMQLNKTDNSVNYFGPMRIYNTNSENNGLYIARGQALGESIRHWVDDAVYHIDYTNDEIIQSIQFLMTSTDTEGSDGSNASSSSVTFSNSLNKSTVTANYFQGALKGNADTATTATTATNATNATQLEGHSSDFYKKSWSAYAGGTSVGWIKLIQWTLTTAGHFTPQPFIFTLHRNYNSPSPESYTLSINTAWGNASIIQLNGKLSNHIIEKFRISQSSDKKIYCLEMYVNTAYTTHKNECFCSISNYPLTYSPAIFLSEVQTDTTVTTLAEITTGNGGYATSLYGLTSTITELNYCDGVTSNIQTQLNSKLNLSGGTMTGTLTLKEGVYTDAANTGALNCNNSNIYGVNGIYFADLCDNSKEGIQFYNTATTVDSLWAKSGVLYFTPSRTLGSTATDRVVLHSGNYSTYCAPMYSVTQTDPGAGSSLTTNKLCIVYS